ncbi:hypothetical protein [Pseudonocardia sp. KRD291]|uniref:hypothetical protein n=1 Tax=Pseudonocardia sp. KRD291 TaxID=2792007 RepID=UPI001C49D574|nr:hypothetical protein [Pseudonocardia sp. KRD291]MBW0103162.1 hypothetical protein [Pseudonocardia sp. KRD291]
MTRTSSSSSARRRTSVRRRAAARVLVPVGGLLLAGPVGAVPALAAETVHSPALSVLTTSGSALAAAPGPFDGAGSTTTLVRVVLLVAGAVLAGLGLLRPFVAGGPGPSGPGRSAEGPTAWVAAVLVTLAALTGYLTGDVDVLGTLAQIVLAVAVPVLLPTVWVVAPALGVVTLVALQLGSVHSGVALAVDVVHALAASVLLGGVLHTAAGDRRGSGDPQQRGATALRRVAIGAGVLAAVAAVVQILLSGPYSARDLVGTGYGWAALVAVLAPLLVTAVLAAAVLNVAGEPVPAGLSRAAARLPGPLRAVAPSRVLGALAAVGVGAAAALAALPVPAAQAVPGQALMRGVDLGEGPVAMLVTPMRPGRNLVQIGDTGPAAGGHTGHDMSGSSGHDMSGAAAVGVGDPATPFAPREGARGEWAVVDIPAGTDSLTVSANGTERTVPIDVGTDAAAAPAGATGPDGPECASAVLGAIVAGGPSAGTATRCPSQSLDPAQATALRALVQVLRTHGVPSVSLVSDSSPRSVAAANLVRAEGAKVGLRFPPNAATDPDSAVLVVSGWQGATATLQEAKQRSASGPTYLGGTYLAPWLLTGGVLSATPNAVLPLTFTPQEPLAQNYVASLAAASPGAAPSTSGFLSWAAAAGRPVSDSPTLYGAAPVDVPMSVEPPGSTGHHGGPNQAAWFPGGTVVQIGRPVDPS